ncbi:MAG: shikimate dehydrogenase [Fibrobacterota bacterium]
MNGTTRLIGLFGWPVGHSRSPQMQNAGFQKLGLNIAYVPLAVEPGRLRDAVNGLRAMNFLGANVTLPHKERVMKHLDSVSTLSRRIGAVNTIVNRNGRLHGTTTDPEGFIKAVSGSIRLTPQTRIMVLGAGGTARTLLFALLAHGCRDLALACRAPRKAARLLSDARKHFKARIPLLTLGAPAFAARMSGTTLLINCTPVGMSPRPNALPLSPALLHNKLTVFDTVYNPLKTRLLAETEKRGGRAVPGMDMLVYQGMASFEVWTGKKPDYATFRKGALNP